MKILTNKFFIIGNILLILIAIPITLFFVKRQQDLRSSAAPTSKLYFSPESPNTSTQCTDFTVDLMVDPGENIVSIVDFYITYDPTKLDVLEIKESDKFPTVVRQASITSGAANMSVSVGADVTKAVQTVSPVATITFKPKVEGPAQIQINSTQSRVFSLAPADEPTENVLLTTSPSNVNITSDACAGGSITPSPSVSATPTAILTPTGGVGGEPTATPTTPPANTSPICTSLEVSPSASGAAPFSVLFTAKGNDPDTGGLITKASFNFGDGQVQDVTEGMNLQNVTVQTNHTYQNSGTYGATVTFTDDNGAISGTCNTQVTAEGGTPSATVEPTVEQPTATTVPPTAVPTVPPTGSIAQTVGVIGAVVLTIVGGFILLAL